MKHWYIEGVKHEVDAEYAHSKVACGRWLPCRHEHTDISPEDAVYHDNHDYDEKEPA
jgi:hypothetical protein